MDKLKNGNYNRLEHIRKHRCKNKNPRHGKCQRSHGIYTFPEFLPQPESVACNTVHCCNQCEKHQDIYYDFIYKDINTLLFTRKMHPRNPGAFFIYGFNPVLPGLSGETDKPPAMRVRVEGYTKKFPKLIE